MITTTRFIFLTCLLILEIISLSEQSNAKNILHIVIDDLRTEINAYNPGHPIFTPSIDKLAKEGVLFDRAWPEPLRELEHVLPLELLLGRLGGRGARGGGALGRAPVLWVPRAARQQAASKQPQQASQRQAATAPTRLKCAHA